MFKTRKIHFLILSIICISSSNPIEIKAVTENAPPFQIVENGHVIDGLAYELIQEVLNNLNINIDIKVYPWSRAYTLAQSEANVLIFSITRTEAREDLFKWIDTIYVLEDYLWALKSSSNTKNKRTANELRYHKTGVQRDDQQYHYLKKWGLSENNGLIIVPTWDQAIKMLYANRLDFVMGSELMLLDRLKENNLDPKLIEKRIYLGKMGSGLFFAFSKQTPDSVVSTFKDAFKKIRKTGRYKEIKDKWIK